ncbi:hypothetical protein MMC25_004988 [Agyrium rufum]|nr:hypothetical protein [Agyrium rufum]
MSTSRIAELASIIASQTAVVDDYLTSRQLPTPSFEPSVSPRLILNPGIAKPRQAILEATDELNALIQGPIGQLTSPAHNYLISLQAIHRFKIASNLPEGEDEVSFADLAQRCGLAEKDMERYLRHAMTFYVFKEPRKGFVSHTNASKLLATNHMLNSWVGMVTDEMWPSAARTIDARIKWPSSQEPNHAGFNLAHGTEKTVFNELAQYPDRDSRYAAAMGMFNAGPGFGPEHLVKNYPFGQLGEATMVDVGGSHGLVSIAIAQNFPALRCIVQDRPEVVAEGKAKLPPELQDRISFMEHDFFHTQPVVGADVYFLRWVLHDWPDKYAIRILRALIPALKPGARVLLNEFVLPEPNAMSPFQERFLRTMDLSMLEFHNAQERGKDDWATLFREADPRFSFSGITQPETSKLGLVEAVWRG